MSETDTIDTGHVGEGNIRGNKIPPFLLAENETPLHSVWRYIVRKISRNPDLQVTIGDVIHSENPIGVGTEINNVCNAKCSFCGYGKGQGGTSSDLRKNRNWTSMFIAIPCTCFPKQVAAFIISLPFWVKSAGTSAGSNWSERPAPTRTSPAWLVSAMPSCSTALVQKPS